MSKHRLVFSGVVGFLMFLSVHANAWDVANDCSVTEMVLASDVSISSSEEVGRVLRSRVTFECTEGEVVVFYSGFAASTTTLFLAQLNNAINLGKQFAEIHYSTYTYSSLNRLSEEDAAIYDLQEEGAEIFILEAFVLTPAE